LICGIGNITKAHLLVLELAERGCFLGMIRGEKFSETLVRTYALQLIQSLNAIHTSGYAHRDLKPENLLLDIHYQMKIADFGLSKATSTDGETGKPSLTYTPLGTRLYMAPEITAGRGYDPKAVDIWAAGFIIFTMLFGVPPWQSPTDWYFQKWIRQSISERELFWKWHQEYAKIKISTDARHMIEGMLTLAPRDRMTMDKLLVHPFFRGVMLT
jgi:serine/threonine protein kinase